MLHLRGELLLKAVSKYTIHEYVTEKGKNPFRDWLRSLDKVSKARVQLRILRFEEGNFGDFKVIGKEIYEARFMFGPGYRVYFSIIGNSIVLLLLAGDKSSQVKDIEKSRKYYLDFIRRTGHD